jgi:hypothetical protein
MLGAHFGRVVWAGGTPVTPELYGPAVFAIPALAWAAGQFVSHGITMVGLALWGRYGMALTIIGGVMAAVFHSFLAYFSSMASQGTLVHAGAMYLTAPGAVLTVMFTAGVWNLGRGGK